MIVSSYSMAATAAMSHAPTPTIGVFVAFRLIVEAMGSALDVSIQEEVRRLETHAHVKILIISYVVSS